MIKNFLSILILILFYGQISAQKMGQWQDYLSYKSCHKVVDGGEKIYCVSSGGLFSFNKTDNSIEKITGLNGLSDFGINTIAYSSTLKVLVVAYNNSNIDLVFEDEVVNISDIKRKMMTADKTINNILFVGSEAYLSCGFGIVALNLEKREVKDTYYIGEDGSLLTVFDMEYDGQNLYAATKNGVYYADYNSPNLLDFNNWHHFDNIPNANSEFQHLVYHSNQIIACHQDFFYVHTGNGWNNYVRRFDVPYDMQVTGNYLTISSKRKIYIVDENHNTVGEVNSFAFQESIENEISTKSAIFSSETGLWAADELFGLVNVKNDGAEAMYPNGPIDNNAFFLHENNNDLYVTSGAITGAWNNTNTKAGIMRLRNGQWNYYTEKEYPELEGKKDMAYMVTDPSNPEHFYVGSWMHGIFEFNNDQLVEHFTEQNSPIESAIPGNPEFYRIGGLDFDNSGTLWAINSEVANVLLSRTTDGEWQSYNLPAISGVGLHLGKLLVTKNNDKWIIVSKARNVYVANDDVSFHKTLRVIAYFSNGQVELETPMNDVLAMTEDKDGEIWLGTTVGVAVYSNPGRIWDPSVMYASQPSLELNDGLFHPLLENKAVTAICVDGANRKWLGTSNSGIYLVSENGDKEIQHFTAENSPLLSNNIQSIAIISKTGEIFIATDKGIISYQGEATEGGSVFENVYAYPNPVRETYDGPITITGLVNDTDLKITDISGNLVYATTSLGGNAIWDGKNLNGNRVKTGVYLIFCSDKEGEETHISKLLFIH